MDPNLIPLKNELDRKLLFPTTTNLSQDFEDVAVQFLMMVEEISELAEIADLEAILATFVRVVKLCLHNGELYPRFCAVLWKNYNRLVRKFGPHFDSNSTHILVDVVATLCKDGIDSILHSFVEIENPINNSSKLKCLHFFQQKLIVTMLTFVSSLAEKLTIDTMNLLICSFGIFRWFHETSSINTTRKLWVEVIGKVKLKSESCARNVDQNIQKLVFLSQCLNSNRLFDEHDWMIFYNCGIQLILEDVMENTPNQSLENFQFCVDLCLDQCASYVYLTNNSIQEELFLSNIYSISSRVARSLIIYSNTSILDSILFKALGCDSCERNEIWNYLNQVVLSFIFLHFDEQTQLTFFRRIMKIVAMISYAPMVLAERKKIVKNWEKLIRMLVSVEDSQIVFDELILVSKCFIQRISQLDTMEIDFIEAIHRSFVGNTHFTEKKSVLFNEFREKALGFVQHHTDVTNIWSLQNFSVQLKIISSTPSFLHPKQTQIRPLATIMLKALQALCRQMEGYAALATMDECFVWKIESMLISINTCFLVVTAQEITHSVSLLLKQLISCCNNCVKAIFTNFSHISSECLFDLMQCHLLCMKPFIHFSADVVQMFVETLETIQKAFYNVGKRWAVECGLMNILNKFKEIDAVSLNEFLNSFEKSFYASRNAVVVNNINSRVKDLMMHRWITDQGLINK